MIPPVNKIKLKIKKYEFKIFIKIYLNNTNLNNYKLDLTNFSIDIL